MSGLDAADLGPFLELQEKLIQTLDQRGVSAGNALTSARTINHGSHSLCAINLFLNYKINSISKQFILLRKSKRFFMPPLDSAYEAYLAAINQGVV